MLTLGRPLLVASLFWVAACGGKASAHEDGARGGAGGSAGSSHGGQSTAGTSSGGNALGGGGARPECEALLDDAPHHLSVLIVNETPDTLYLGQERSTCGAAPLFEVTDESSRVLIPPGMCRTSCESAMTAGPSGCPPICLLPSAVELAPGAKLWSEWAGTYIELVKLPEVCQRGEQVSPQCDRAIAVEPGAFVFSASAGTSLDCSQGGGDCSACTPDAQTGGCVIQGALIAGDIRRAETRVELDASYGVGPGNGDAAIRLIELRFTAP